MGLIDTHAHLTHEDLFERVDEVLERAAAAGVEHVITVASDASDSAKCLELARSRSALSCTAGVHPHEANKVRPGDLERVAALWKENQVVAVGEIGLDYYYDFSDRPTQLRVFERQLEMAAGRDLPLVIHCRDAFDDTVGLLRRRGYPGKRVVFHCFTGSADEHRVIVEEGWRASFTGVVTFKKSEYLHEIVRACPADRLMLETDSPYLSPAPIRHVRPNEPAHVAHTARFVADLRGVTFDELADQTTANARAFFNLP